jgi:hypothetical protein
VLRKPTDFAFFTKVLRGIKRQIREVQGPEPEDLRRYYRAYAAEMEKVRPARCGSADFCRAACGSPVVLVGDFHTLDQAQKQFLRVLKALDEEGARPVVGLEMVQALHDGGLQQYLAGRADEGDLLETIGYFDHWGFDFGHYRPILEYLRERAIPARGINREGTLNGRDTFMASRIEDLVDEFPGRTVLVLVGDLHLAGPHLVGALRKRGIKPLILFQNSESVFMRSAVRGGMLAGQIPESERWWHIGDRKYLVNNTVPWVKMMTYLIWLEHGGEALCSVYGYHCSGEEDGEVDLTETIHGYIRVLKQLFELRNRADDDFQVFTLKDLEFLHRPYFRHEPGKSYKRIIQAGRPLFLTWKNTVYIPMLDVNRTAQEAAHYLMGRNLNVDEGRTAFHDRIHYYASGFVASKLINPLRHENSIEELRDFIAQYPSLRRTKEKRYLEPRYEASRGALEYLERMEGGRPFPGPFIEGVLRQDRESDFALSEILGRYMGGCLFRRYNRGELSGLDLRQYIFEQHNPFLYHRK